MFGQFWAKKMKVVKFGGKLGHTTIHLQYLEDADSYSEISFLKFQT